MLRSWLYGVAAVLLLTSLAQAQDAGRLRLDRPGAAEIGLRGTTPTAAARPFASAEERPEEPAEPAPAPRPAVMADFAPMSLPRPPSAAQCRTGCAQDYYFCLAGDQSDECAPAWGQCRLACGPG